MIVVVSVVVGRFVVEATLFVVVAFEGEGASVVVFRVVVVDPFVV